MMNIVPIKAYQDNYIWLIVNETSQTAIAIDPGEASPVCDYLHTVNLDLTAVLITHHHRDHCHGIPELQRHFDMPVYGPKHNQIPATQMVEADSHIHLSHVDFRVLALPGHTLSHVAYYAEKPGWLFCGDTLFSAGCGRMFEGSPQQMWSSLMRLAALPDDTQVYCAHEYTLANLHFARQVEPRNRVLQQVLEKTLRLRQQGAVSLPSTIGLEKQINPFLRCQQPEVIKAATAFHGGPLLEPYQVFAALRHWKDSY